MSRYELQPRADASGVVGAAVGWDRPLQTFFAQVFERDADGEDHATLWIGTEPGELASPEAAIALVAVAAVIPADLASQLATDRDASVGTGDGPEQRFVKEALFGKLH